MSSSDQITTLTNQLNSTLDTFKSAHELLEQTCSTELKKQFILDSFKITKTHKDYKHWEHQQIGQFIDDQVHEYNHIVANIHRINTTLDKLTQEYEHLIKTVRIPEFQFSVKTLQMYGDESLINLIPDGVKVVKLSQLFSFDDNSPELIKLDYNVINQLINIEFKLRIKLRIKYEVLNLIKLKIMANNSKWNIRNSYLTDFIDKKLTDAINQVEKIKNDEGVNVKQQSEYMSEDEEEEVNMQESSSEDEQEPEPEPEQEQEHEHIEEHIEEEHMEEEHIEEPIEEHVEEHIEEHIEEQEGDIDLDSEREENPAPVALPSEPTSDEEDLII
ncbi:hypothetical protein JA1_005214 [Spathaspora sp. JA1]|nr:hypothetical protein JA1_005214 [Spathaspora sp. JA1]